MADNTTLNAGTGGDTIATDDIGGIKHQRVKLSVGADGAASDAIPVSNGLDTTAAGVQAVGLVAQFDDASTGTVTENQFAPVRLSTRRALLVEGVASGTAQPISAASLPLPTGAATDAKQDTGNTSVASIDTKTTADQSLDYDTGGGTVTQKIVGIALPASGGPVAGGTATNPLTVTVGAALPAGSNAIGKLAANAGVTIGAVEVAAAQTLATVTTVSTVTTLSGGGVAHDGADSGNPVKVGAKCSLTLSDDTIVSNADRTDLTSDGDGALLVRGQFPLADLISERVSNTDGASTAFSNFGAVASTRSVITAIHAFRTDAGTTPIYIDFRDGTAGAILYSLVLPPNGGAVLPAGATPYFKTTANTALAFDVSAATTTVYISISGFKSKVV